MSDLDEALKTFKPPVEGQDTTPYICYWRDATYYKDNEKITKKELTCMTALASNGNVDKVLYYVNKPGWEIVKFYLPDTEAYLPLKGLCEKLINKNSSSVKLLEDENQALKAKVEALSQRMKHVSKD